jgi:chorismate mutase
MQRPPMIIFGTIEVHLSLNGYYYAQSAELSDVIEGVMAYIIIFLSSLFMVGSVFAASVSAVAISSLSTAMNDRMIEMKNVAAFKAAHHLPVEDLERENKVVSLAQDEAADAGLDPHSVLPFIKAQMDVAKAIQYRYFADWLSHPDADEKPESLDKIRANISAQDKKIVNNISQRLMVGEFNEEDKSELLILLQAPHLTESDKDSLIRGLSTIKRMK